MAPKIWHSFLYTFVRSFLRGGSRPLAVSQRAFSLPLVLRPRLVRPRPGPVHYSPLTLGLVLYIYRAQFSRWVSLARWQSVALL